MVFDMREFRRFMAETCRKVPIEHSEPSVEIRVSRSYVAEVRLEMLDVHNVESDDGRVETDIGFCDVFTIIEWSFSLRGEVFLCPVQGLEERVYVLFVCFLGCGKATLVDSIVDVVISPLVRGVNLLAEIRRIQNYISVFLREKIIELVFKSVIPKD